MQSHRDTQFSRDDQAIVSEFEAEPFGRASRPLRDLLNVFRSAPIAGKYCIVVLEPHRVYQLARTSGVLGKGPTPVDGATFPSRLAAEIGVFKLRLRELRDAEAVMQNIGADR